ncbi:MAG: phage holin family protein [Leptolyngbyaceae cyanobacterium bins.302]|nr:phage holin family protein [Leptolyngbyaceae cyanobacterium bins.302]
MFGFFLTTLISALGLLVVDLVVPGVNIATFPAALLAAIAIGVVNGSIRPVLSILTLPINFLTLGAFSFVLNGVCFWLASLLVPGFAVHGLLAMILGPVVLSLASTFLNRYFAEKGTTHTVTGTRTPVNLEAGK